jgi:hypothetical protein
MGFLATVMKGVPERAIQFLMLRETRALARTFVLRLATSSQSPQRLGEAG